MDIQSSKNPKFIFWVDLETTGLDPISDSILEMAYILTEFQYPYKELNRGHYLLDLVGRRDLLEGLCSEFITELHKKSGLFDELAGLYKLNDVGKMGGLYSGEYVNNELFALSELKFGNWQSFEKDEKVIIGGSSCHFDLSFLRSHFTEFASKLSYRSFDASALMMFCRSLGMPHQKKEESHRALQDIKNSIKLARDCIKWIHEHARGSLPEQQKADDGRCQKADCYFCRGSGDWTKCPNVQEIK